MLLIQALVKSKLYTTQLVLLCAMITMLLLTTSCATSDEPLSQDPQEVCLRLSFATDFNDTELDEEDGSSTAGMCSRYTIYAYKPTATGRSVGRSSDVIEYLCQSQLDSVSCDSLTAVIELTPGTWTVMAWYDTVDDDTGYEYYDCTNPTYVAANTAGYRGCDTHRDVYRGSTTIKVGNEPTDADIAMGRPLAKYKLIGTDLAKFFETQGADADLSTYTVRIYYNGFLPTVFNLFTDSPCDAYTGIWYDGYMHRISDSEVELGYDYVFVSSSGTSVPVVVAVYDGTGTMVSMSTSCSVPLVRNKVTTVRGEFLSSTPGYGPSIDPAYSGSYNYYIN
jgi:hypothetical protein